MKLRRLLMNLGRAPVTFVILIVFFELVVFRFVLVAPDMPRVTFADDVVRYLPNQSGTYRVQNEITARYHINANGWNSRHDVYPVARSDRYRIALIGDSHVAALRVDVDQSVAERLEDRLGASYEVFRFAISGAPLSQYLHMLRHEVAAFTPDLVIVIVTHNDFGESYRFVPGVYTRSFLKLHVDGGDVTGEVEPVAYHEPWYRLLRRSGAWRYLAYRRQMRFDILRRMIFRDGRKDVTELAATRAADEAVTEYIFAAMKNVCDDINADLLIVMDGDRRTIEAGRDTASWYETGAPRLNAMAAAVAERQGIGFIDLHPVFEEDRAANPTNFHFTSDGHWNPYTHDLVAKVIASSLETQALR